MGKGCGLGALLEVMFEAFYLHLFLPECQMLRSSRRASLGGLLAMLTSLMFLTWHSQSNCTHRLTGTTSLLLRGCKEKHSSPNVMRCCWFSSSKCSDPLGASLFHQSRRGLISKLLCTLYSCQGPWKLDLCIHAWRGRRH